MLPGARLPADANRPPLVEAIQEIEARLGDPKLAEKQEKLRQRKSSAQVLRGSVDLTRRGGVAGLKSELLASGRYSL